MRLLFQPYPCMVWQPWTNAVSLEDYLLSSSSSSVLIVFGVVYRMAWYTAGDQSRERFDTMVTMLITCRHCGSPDLTKYGIAPNGKQKYRCRTCRRQSRENPGSAAYAPERKEEILRAYQERSSLRGLERTFGVARSTVISWLKKSPLPLTSPNDLDRS